MEAMIVLVVFVICYAFLLLDKLNRALVAGTGAAILVLFGIFSWDEALSSYVDWSTIALLFSMMVMISITQRTGVFEYIALWMIKRVEGRPIPLFFWVGWLTAIGSALLDNVTTVLLLVPVLLHMIKQLNVKAFPYLVNIIISSNIGGTATMIGDPPNIMIGQAVPYLDFLDFLFHLGPIILIIQTMVLGLLYLLFSKSLNQSQKVHEDVIKSINPSNALVKSPLLYQSISILILTIVAFTFHSFLHVELTTIAIISALLMLLISEKDESSEIVFSKVEWTTLFFFIGLFVLVGGLEKAGIIDQLAYTMIDWTEGDALTSSLVILWSAGMLSGFVDNIPYVASMIPVIEEFQALGVSPIDPLWWSLALGACLGGNGSLLGASANVVVAGIASTNGEKIQFIKFMFYGLFVVILSLIISMIYIVLRYFV